MACILSKTPILYRAAYYKNIIFGPITKGIWVKNYGYFTPNKSDVMIEKKFRIRDKVTNDYKLIYREHNTLCKTVNFAYYIGWISLLFGVCSSWYFITKDPPVETKKYEGIFGLVQVGSESNRPLLIIGSMLIPTILILGCRLLPFRIYYSPSQRLYKAVFVNNILYKNRNIEIFGEGCAIPVFKTDTLFKINGRILLLERNSFTAPTIREKMIYRVK